MTTHIMCDLETLCKRPGGVVLAAAFVRCHDEAHCTLNLSIEDQTALGLEQDQETITWWHDNEARNPGAWAIATANPQPLNVALPYFIRWLQWAAPDGDFLLWCHGATFDGPILGEVYRRAGIECPWTRDFWRVQCTRTAYNLAGINPKDYAVPPPHVALNDALGQSRALVASLKILARAHLNPGAWRYFHHPESGCVFHVDDGSRPQDPLCEEITAEEYLELAKQYGAAA